MYNAHPLVIIEIKKKDKFSFSWLDGIDDGYFCVVKKK